MEFHSVGTGLLMMLGIASQRYLSISDKGRLQGVVSVGHFIAFTRSGFCGLFPLKWPVFLLNNLLVEDGVTLAT